jgi:hypothetical protein
MLTAVSGANYAQTVVRFAPIRVRFVETVARFTRTPESGEPMCRNIAGIGAQTHHGRNYVPTVWRFVVTPANCAATVETFAAMFAIGAAMSAIIDTIAAVRGAIEIPPFPFGRRMA